MIVVRDVLTARPGMASKLATLFKEVAGMMPADRAKMRVMTDATGPFNTVVLESEIESFAAWEDLMAEFRQRPEVGEKMKGYTDLYLTGSREIYRLV